MNPIELTFKVVDTPTQTLIEQRAAKVTLHPEYLHYILEATLDEWKNPDDQFQGTEERKVHEEICVEKSEVKGVLLTVIDEMEKVKVIISTSSGYTDVPIFFDVHQFSKAKAFFNAIWKWKFDK